MAEIIFHISKAVLCGIFFLLGLLLLLLLGNVLIYALEKCFPGENKKTLRIVIFGSLYIFIFPIGCYELTLITSLLFG